MPTTGRPVAPERATELSVALHNGPLQSMLGARFHLARFAMRCPELADVAEEVSRDLLASADVVRGVMDELDPAWHLERLRARRASAEGEAPGA